MGQYGRSGSVKTPAKPLERKEVSAAYSQTEKEAAECVVSILFRNPELFDKCDLNDNDFADHVIRAAYGCIRASASRNQRPDAVVYAGQVGCDIALIRDVCERSCSPSLLGQFTRIVSDASLNRKIHFRIQEARGDLENPGSVDTELVLESLITNLTKCRRGTQGDVSGGTYLNTEVERIIDLKRRKDNGEAVRLGVSTGLTTLDSYIGGLTRGLVTAAGAITKMGKSSFSLQCAIGAAADGEEVIYFPLEDKVSNTMHRLIARETGITAQCLRSLRFETADLARIQRAEQSLAPIVEHIHWDDSAGLTGVEIARRIRRKAAALRGQGKKLGLAVVDYLQLVRPEKGIDENVSIINTMRELTAVAKDEDIAVLAVSQLNDRKVTGRGEEIFGRTGEYTGYKPEFSDFKWSSAIEECSKLVLLFHRPAFFDKSLVDDEFQIIVALCNFGESAGKVLPYVWEGNLTKIVNKVKSKKKEL